MQNRQAPHLSFMQHFFMSQVKMICFLPICQSVNTEQNLVVTESIFGRRLFGYFILNDCLMLEIMLELCNYGA
jgi:hypothetical protein